MKTKVAGLVWGLSLALFVGWVFGQREEGPARVASHFDAAGTVNGWTDRAEYLRAAGTTGAGLSLFIVAIYWSARFLRPGTLNLPRAAYWREPGNYQRACARLLVFGLWTGSGLLWWAWLMMAAVREANQVAPPALDSTRVWLLSGVLAAGVAAGLGGLLWGFSREGAVEKSLR